MHGPDGPFFNPQEWVPEDFVYGGDIPTPHSTPWPRQEFTFSATQLLDGGAISTTRGSRLRAVADALADNPDNLAAFQTADQPLTQSVLDVERFLKKRLRLKGEDTCHQQLMPPEFVLGTIEQVWVHENNPILQALHQVHRKYHDHMAATDFEQLVRDTMFATHRSLIMQMYITHKRSLQA
jgi:hypothetical protein